MSYLEQLGKVTKIDYQKDDSYAVETFDGPLLAKFTLENSDDLTINEDLVISSVYNLLLNDGFFIRDTLTFKLGVVKPDESFDALSIRESFDLIYLPPITETHFDALPIIEDFEVDFIPAWRRENFSVLSVNEHFEFRLATNLQHDQYDAVSITENYNEQIILALRRTTFDTLSIQEVFDSYLGQDVPFNRTDALSINESFSLDIIIPERVYPGDQLSVKEIYSGRKAVRLSDFFTEALSIREVFNYGLNLAVRADDVFDTLSITEDFSWYQPNEINAPDVFDALSIEEIFSDTYENNQILPPTNVFAIRNEQQCSIAISWVAPSGQQPDLYEIQAQAPSSSYSHLATINATNLEYNYLNVPINGTWRFRVRSIRNGVQSAWSNEAITNIFCIGGLL